MINKKNIIVLTVILVCLFAFGFNFKYSFAASPSPTITTTDTVSTGGGKIVLPPDPGNLPNVDVDSLIGTVIRILFAVGQIAFVIVLLIGGVMFITSAGNEEQAGKARKLMLYAMIGIIVLFSAWAIASFIAETLSG